MRLSQLVLLASFVAFLGLVRSAEAKPNDGIMVWRLQSNENIKESDVKLISNFMAAQVAQYSGRKVTSESDIDTVLKGDETKQRCGIDDDTCLVEIGNALGVPEAVSGDIGKIGSFWILNLRRVNIKTADSIARCSRSLDGSVDALIRELPGAVAELFGKEPPKPAVARKESPEEQRPTTGVLVVRSKPDGAEVFAGDLRLGKTPLQSTLKPGDYQLRLSKNDYKESKRSVSVKSGEKTKVSLKLKKVDPGSLLVATEPAGAEVMLGGSNLGKTPCREANLLPGEYDLSLSYPGYEQIHDQVVIVSNETTTKRYVLDIDYPMNPYKKYGYVSFFTGVGLTILGGVATWQAQVAADDVKSGSWDAEASNKVWSGVTITGYVLGAAGMATGIVLWLLSPGDKAWAESHPVVGVSPDESGKGATVSLQGRW